MTSKRIQITSPPTEATNYSLWKATRKLQRLQQHNPPIKSDTYWARNDEEKVEVFSKHLERVFKPFPSELTDEEGKRITDSLDIPFQLELPHPI